MVIFISPHPVIRPNQSIQEFAIEALNEKQKSLVATLREQIKTVKFVHLMKIFFVHEQVIKKFEIITKIHPSVTSKF